MGQKKKRQIDMEGMEISVGAKTGRIYVRDPTKCSKIYGVNTQCRLYPVPGSKMCQKHIDLSKKCQMLQQLRKNKKELASQNQDKPHKSLNKKDKLNPTKTKTWKRKLCQTEVGNSEETHKLQPRPQEACFN
ncbi:hypothetical protein KI387_031483, partial [Taxus chinensis]